MLLLLYLQTIFLVEQPFDGSVLVNNIPQLNANPSTGILLGTIAPNISIPVTFSVTVVALPASGRIQNQSTSRYTIIEEQISTSNITFTEVILL